ncbi:hypothetical protein M5689_020093 [Euphorbia peplus]|nr:hypothetical protein M5689_020093 [Euphorbia peplus]
MNDILQILSSECVSDGLKLLHLADCELSRHLTDDLSYFKNLTFFDISSNYISGPVPLSLGDRNSLEILDLSSNRLNGTGTLPESLGNLSELEELDISNNNKLEGEISDLHFENLTKLTHFGAFGMGKNIALRVSSDWIPPLQLQTLQLGSWKIGSRFPKWLHLLKHLTDLDLSNSGISAAVPVWFWDSFRNYKYLNFSQNRIPGSVPNIPFVNGFMPGY